MAVGMRSLIVLLLACQLSFSLRLTPGLRLSPAPDIKDKVLIYNSLTRKKEKFQALDEKQVKFYSCGPTVYDFAHIGNFRAFLTYDILKRWLIYCGYNVQHICNLTDVDDKIIMKMKLENKSLKEITNTYANAFFEDLSVLNIIPASSYPRATEHIQDIIDMIDTLIQKGFAYIENGSVYFRVNKFNDYGKMVNFNLNKDEMREGAGGSGPNERRGTRDKEDERDFVLWKAFNEGDGEVAWESKFGKGRPGWHIECSAMINSLLGKTIDLHGGGVDLMFPHHTNEIAQSEAYSGQKMCNCWVHNGFVNVNNEKMSKSLKNFKTLRDIAKSDFDARAFRFMIVSAQYRAPLNFSPEAFSAAVSSLKRIDKAVAALKDASNSETRGETEDLSGAKLNQFMEDFESALCDDINTPRGVAVVFSFVSSVEKALSSGGISSTSAEEALSVFRSMDSILGIVYDVPKSYFPEQNDSIPEEIYDLARKRSSFKANKMYAEADAIRQQIANKGYAVKDIKGGSFELVKL